MSTAKKLYRSRHDRILAGVCGGLGNFFDIDPTWIRLLFVILIFAAGLPVLIYFLMWLIVPLEPISSIYD